MKRKLTVVLALVMLMLASAGAVYANASTDYLPPITAHCCGCMVNEVSIVPSSPPTWENGGTGGNPRPGTWEPCCRTFCGCNRPDGSMTSVCPCAPVFVPFG